MADYHLIRVQGSAVGKSRACHDCKRRKVKVSLGPPENLQVTDFFFLCDYRYPTCLRCEKANIPCQGYQRDTVFVNRTAGACSVQALSVVQSSSLGLRIPRTIDEELYALRLHIEAPTGPPVYFRRQALSLLKKLYLPRWCQAYSAKASSLFSWVFIICELKGNSLALDHSLFTFCVIQVAITKTGNACVDDALQAYNSALQNMLLEIEHAAARQTDELLAAISVLSTCELFVCRTDHGWRAHIHGIREILRVRNEEYSTTPVWQSFCMRLRVVLLFEGLMKRRGGCVAILNSSNLMSISGHNDSFHWLIDIGCEVSISLKEIDTVITSYEVLPEDLKAGIVRDYLTALEKLHDQHQRYSAGFSGPMYWVMPSMAHNPADDGFENKLYPFALHFKKLETASQLVLWWAILLHILRAMTNFCDVFLRGSMTSSELEIYRFEDLIEPDPLCSRYPTVSSLKGEADKLARYLCQSMEFCFKVEHGTIGAQMTCYAQFMLKEYFRERNYERELAWCYNIKNMTGPGIRAGIELMEFND